MKKFVVLLSAVILMLTGLVAAARTVHASADTMSLAVLEVSTNRLLYGINLDKKMPMASTTKVLTAITVIENCDNLDAIVEVPKKAAGVEGSSIYLKAGEKLKIIDLLYGLMLQSGNDCAEALAILTSGDIAAFAELMNKTADKIGAKNSHFMNPHGLHHENHYTTALDLARISSYALKNETFKKIVSTKIYTIETRDNTTLKTFRNKNKLLASFSGCDGVKTGFTKKAGRCFVSSATRDGMQVVSVVLNCPQMFETCRDFMEKAFAEYTLTKIVDKNVPFGKTTVSETSQKFLDCYADRDFYYPLKKGEETLIKTELTVNPMIAPVPVNTEIGNIKISLDNRLLFDEKLYNMNEVPTYGYLERLKFMIGKWVNN